MQASLYQKNIVRNKKYAICDTKLEIGCTILKYTLSLNQEITNSASVV